MMTIYDPSTNVLRVNPAFERLIGWSSEALSGISLMEQVYPDPEYREQAREYMQACFTVARELRADPALQGVLLIALTGWDQEDARLRSAQAGFDHHLVKPVGAATLVDLLAKYARGGRRARGDA